MSESEGFPVALVAIEERDEPGKRRSLRLSSLWRTNRARTAQRMDRARTARRMPSIWWASSPSRRLESIGPGIRSIRAFLQAGVPAELVRAALRSAWSTDPQIREFIEMADNQWDFNAEDGIPGFGALGVADASRSLVSRALESSDEVLPVVRQVSSGSVGLLPPAPVPVTEPEVHDEVWRAGGVIAPRAEVAFDTAPGSGGHSTRR